MKLLPRRIFTAVPAVMLTMVVLTVHAASPPQTIAKALPATDISSTSATVIDGLYEVVAGGNVLYVDKTGRYLVIGSIYDLHEDKDLSAERRAEVTRTAAVSRATTDRTTVEQLPLSSAITTGGGDRSLTVITDTQCAWCRRLWLESLRDLDGVTVNHLLVNSSAQALGILCAEDPGKALGRAFDVAAATVKTPVPSALCRRQAAEKIARVVRFAERLNLLGTPVLIRDDGDIHAGYLGRTALISWLGDRRDDG
jgi:thiol:disulfide interchange protein DsbC